MSHSNMRDNPRLHLLPELMSARQKLAKAMEFFNSQHDGSGLQIRQLQGLRGFESKSLDPRVFREQVFRAFHVRLDNKELGALLLLFDKSGSGHIDTNSFFLELVALGRKRKEENQMKRTIEKEDLRMRRARRAEKSQQKALESTIKRLPSEWTEEDEHSAVNKIKHAALSYDRMKLGGLKGFLENGYLDATQLSEQLRRNFDVILTPREIAAIMGIFDTQGTGFLETHEFIYHFFRMGRVERDRLIQSRLNKTYELNRKKQDFEHSLVNKFNANSPVFKRIPEPSDEHKESFLKKLRQAAIAFDISTFTGWSQSNFEVVSVNHEAFRDTLKKHFGLSVTPGELAAAVKLFDLDRDNRISCNEFSAVFNKLRSQEMSRLEDKHRRITGNHFEEMELKKREKLHRAMEKMRLRVDRIILPSLSEEEDEELEGECSFETSRGEKLKRVSAATKQFLAEIKEKEIAIRYMKKPK